MNLDKLIAVGAAGISPARHRYVDFGLIKPRVMAIDEIIAEAALRAILPLLKEMVADKVSWAHMVPPDGGSPTDAEKAVADNAAEIARNLFDNLLQEPTQ